MNLGGLSDFDVCPMNFGIDEEVLECAKSFLYLEILTHDLGYSTPKILKRLGLAGGAFGSLITNIWDSRLALSTKVHLFHTYVLPVLLYGVVTWAIIKKDLLGCIWYEVYAHDMRHQTVRLH